MAQEISNADLAGAGLNVDAQEEKDESFEEILESRDIIESKIFSIKQRMIDFTVRQWDTQTKITALRSDIDILQEKIDETL